MVHRIDPDEHYVAGESVTWTFTIEQDGAALDLTGASVAWYLLDQQGDANADALLDDSDTGVSASITDSVGGIVEVAIDRGVTDGFGGRVLWHRLTVDDAGTGRQIWGGPFPVGRL